MRSWCFARLSSSLSSVFGWQSGLLMASLSLSSSPIPNQLRSQKRSCLQEGRCLFHSPSLALMQIHSRTYRQKTLVGSLGSAWHAWFAYLRARVGSIKWAQASDRLREGSSWGLVIWEQVSAAVAQWASWQERVPLLVSISLRSGQQLRSSRLWQMATSISAHSLKCGSSGRIAWIFSSYSSEMRMKKRSRFSSSIQMALSLPICSFCSFLKAAVKRSKVAAEWWVVQSAQMIMQSVQYSSFVSAARAESV